MKKEIRMKRLLLLTAMGVGLLSMNCNLAHAEDVQYTYDTLGRVKTATYSDGTQMTYQYDSNGNIQNIEKTKKKQDSTEGKENNDKENDNNESDTSETGNKGNDNNEADNAEKNNDESKDDTDMKPDSNFNPGNEKGGTLDIIRQIDMLDSTYIETLDYLTVNSLQLEVQNYNRFKKKKPVIYSLKTVTKNAKLYLKIKIKKLQMENGYKELGYEIQYATNKKFKDAKTENVTRDKKKKMTSKSWKVKKNKTYYVKVRAYMKTKKGKKIYTKYSAVKNITVKP